MLNLKKTSLTSLNRLFFFKPINYDIIIFDEINADLVNQTLPKKFSRDIFKCHPVNINLWPTILVKFFLNLKLFKFKQCTGSPKKIFYECFWQLLMIYVKADLDLRKPKGIVTFIDNSKKFAWLSENFNLAPCIAIQNGFRLKYASQNGENYYCQHLFCFGQQQVENFKKMDYRVDHFYPVGSLILSNNFKVNLKTKKPKYDFLVISCWRGNIGFNNDVKDSMNSMRIMDKLFCEYLKKNNYKSAIMLRSEKNSSDWFMPEIGMSEEDYYLSIYGNLVDIIQTDFTKRNVYPMMQNADVIIAGFSTTCLVEAFATGKKVLYANFCNTDKYHTDFSKKIVFDGKKKSPENFWTRLNNLKNVSVDIYKKKHHLLMNYYVQSPTLVSTQEKIEKKIDYILKKY